MLNEPTAASLPEVTIRARPEDFQVEEIPAYPPSGTGDHVFVTFRKRGLTTPFALRRIADALSCDPRDAGAAGMKDRHAITVQTASFLVPADCDPEALLGRASLEDIEIVSIRRHPHKLRAGHLVGNRFALTLRAVEPKAMAAMDETLQRLRAEGLPNAFGPQRFGRDGDNAQRALGWIAGSDRPPRDRRRRKLLASSLQSWLFNELLAERVADGSWRQIIGGDLAKKHDSGGMFAVTDDGPELSEAQRRAAAGELCATGPMFGNKMRWPTGEAGVRERAVLERHIAADRRAAALKRMGKGTRRPLRLLVGELGWQLHPQDRSLSLHFSLPKGGYATSVLAQFCRPVDGVEASSR